MKKHTIAALIAAPVLALSLAACDGETASKDTSAPSGSNASSTSEEIDEDLLAASEDEVPENLSFGDTATYPNGLSISVGEPSAFTPNEWAAGGESHSQHVKFPVKIVNNTGVPFDPTMVYLSMQSGNTEADEVFDSESGIGSTATTSVLDGREATFTAGFGVDDPSDLVLEVDPGDMENSASIFVKGGE